MDGAGSYSVAHRAGLLPTELTGMWGWILLRSPHRGRGSPPVPAPTKQRPAHASDSPAPLGLPARQPPPSLARTSLCLPLVHRFGLYILGNPNLLERCAHWKEVLTILRTAPEPMVGESLPLVCSRHSDAKASAHYKVSPGAWQRAGPRGDVQPQAPCGR